MLKVVSSIGGGGGNGAVTSVNGQVGAVVLTATDVNAVANTATITAGTGLTGGGVLASNTTISLANTSVVAGLYGDSSNVAQITVDAQGRITSVSNVAISGGGGGSGTVTNVATGTGLTGGPITTTGTISLANTAVSAGSYGNATSVATFTVDAQGRLTNAANVSISFPAVSGNVSVDSIDFNTTANITVTESLLTWDATFGTLALGLKGGLPLELGFENLVLVYNNTGSALTKGQVVSITGAQGQQPTVGLSVNTSEALSRDTIGVVQEAIPNADTGYVCTFGVVTNINTYGTTAGDPLYLSNVAGSFTSTQPVAPAQTVALGWVVRVSSTPSSTDGQIFVSVRNGWELEELHNVLITSPSNNQVLVYNTPSNLWVNLSQANLTAGTGLTGGGQLLANTNVTITLANTAVSAGTYGGGTNAASFVVDAQGRLTSAANVAIPQGTVVEVGTGTGLTGGPVTSNGTISLANTTVTADSYGSANTVSTFTVDQQGRLTAAGNAAISIANTQVSGLGTMSIQNANNVSISGGLISNVTLDNVTVQTESFDNVTLSNVTIVSGNATFTNVTASQANLTTANVTSLSSGNVTITGGVVSVSNISAANVTVTANLYANLATSNTAAMPDPSLPLNPEGYLTVIINGAAKKIPYYGV